MDVERILLSPSVTLGLQEVKAAHGPSCVTEGVPVRPATEFTPLVNATTVELCQEAAAHQQAGLVYMQRQLVKQIPVCKVTADSPAFSFTVYGEGQDVSADEYPAQSCCGYPKVAALLVALLIALVVLLVLK